MDKKKKQIYMIAIFVLAFVIGIGYALLNSTLNITGNTKVKGTSWDVHFENFSPKSGSVTATSAGIDTNKTSVNYTITLAKPGDFYEFEVDAVNKGSIDAMINTISNTGLTTAQKRYMTYSVAYSDGTEIAEKQELPAKTGKETIKVKVEYKKDITASDLPETNQTLTLTFSVNYVQADGSAIPVRTSVCRRATTLHTETCSRTDNWGCVYDGGHTGDTITYGSLGTKGTLTPGDAFDCDVNGDGTYNVETERFYYVSPLDANNDYGVLIYYNDVSGGLPNSTKSYPISGNVLPLAKSQLPTISQWSNVSLYDNTSYEGYAARFIKYNEIQTACGGANLMTRKSMTGCKYFLENTTYTTSSGHVNYWMDCTSTYRCYCSYGSYVSLYDEASQYQNGPGTRPVIEVPMTDIQK